MRLQRLAWVLAAAALAASAATAHAQRANGVGVGNGPGHGISTHGGNGGRLTPNGGLLDGPGISVTPGPQFIDNGPVKPDTPRRERRTQRRGNPAPAGGGPQLPDEVVFEVASSAAAARIDAMLRSLRLTVLDRQTFQLTGKTFYRCRITDGRSVAAVTAALRRNAAVVDFAQGNSVFTAQADAKSPAADAQYELAKLHLPQAHAIAKGDNVRVAVIDSGVDVSNPELAGSIADTFDTLDPPTRPHAHGTSIAALIAAHGKLTGSAPDAQILAARAFDAADNGGARGNTFNILKGLDWAASQGARVVNMSFAGPNDAALHRLIVAAHEKGIVLVAAAGNAGPRSPPLFPAADPNVIAVTATDAADKLFAHANRGDHIAIAAPGDQILVALPGGKYEVSSGTSYSAAEISGIVALMLQREPDLTPEKVRAILMRTARDLGDKGRDPLFGAGLADAYGALMAEKPPVATAASPAEKADAGRR